MAHYINVEIELEGLHCSECSCTFFVNRWWVEHQIGEQNEIYCPAGHKTLFLPEEPAATDENIGKIKSENTELKKRLFQALHDAEQGEAKKSEDAKTTKRKAV